MSKCLDDMTNVEKCKAVDCPAFDACSLKWSVLYCNEWIILEAEIDPKEIDSTQEKYS